jgi:hypothetical protein
LSSTTPGRSIVSHRFSSLKRGGAFELFETFGNNSCEAQKMAGNEKTRQSSTALAG